MDDKHKLRARISKQLREARKEHERLVEENGGDSRGFYRIDLDLDDVPGADISIGANYVGWEWLADLLDALGEEG